MNEIIFMDFETTGIPDWKQPSGDECQPHIVQIGAIVANADTREALQVWETIIRPDGWEIPQDMTDIHGISNEQAMDEGIPEQDALEIFLGMWGGRKRVAFNTTFDNRIIRIATKRFSAENVIDDWKAGEYECAMQLARKDMGVKSVKLVDAYLHYFNAEFEGQHTAMADARAAMAIYFAIVGDDSYN